MKDLNRVLLIKIILCILLSLSFVECDPKSSGSNETQQLDNDNDPTTIETGEATDTLLMDGTIELDENGEFVVIRDFDHNRTQKFREEFNLQAINDSATSQMNSRIIGVDDWKSWGEYQFRVVYSVDGGSLKAKPILKNNNNEQINLSFETIDSLNLSTLWTEIQHRSLTITNNYK